MSTKFFSILYVFRTCIFFKGNFINRDVMIPSDVILISLYSVYNIYVDLLPIFFIFVNEFVPFYLQIFQSFQIEKLRIV